MFTQPSQRKETTNMPIHRATPEETLAFYGKPLMNFGQKRPSSLKKNSNFKQAKPQGTPSKTPQQSPPELRKLAHNLSDLARSKLEKKNPTFTVEENE